MEMINHFSHEEHQLILKEMKEEDNKEVVCYGCEKSVSGSTYCCSVCEVFLHKSCAELPLEFTHPMHYEHPLQLFSKPTYGSESCICNICRRSWSGFTYHCSECYFDVDVLCAKLEMLKHTMDGKHPLILKELKAGSSADVVCYGCQQPVSGSTYWCSECEVFLHKSCAELPLEFTHPMHSEHPLVLLVKLAYVGECDICDRSLSGFTYHCFECKFDVDVLCAKLEIFKHTMDGKHPLILKELQQEDMSSEKVVCCGVCEQLIVSGSSTYFCSICEVFLHKSCAQLLSEIMHPTHTACHHPLKLIAKSPSGSTCYICDRSCGSGFAYGCYKCEFYLDVLCAQLHGTILEHPSHQHPLKLQLRSALFRCDACGTEKKDESYDCTVCSFWIHKSCGSLPSNLSHKCHPHPLVVAYCFPEQYRRYGIKCDICREKLYPNCWLLYCGPCRYFVHIKCMTSYSEEDEAAEANSAAEIPRNCISLPAEVLSAQLIRHFFEEKGFSLIEHSKEINHFSHDHPLILTNIQDDYSEMDGDDQETVCSACIEPILGSCYGCAQCSYFIHLHCADQLPNNLSSSYHPQHQLSLNHFRQEFFGYFKCSCCRRVCNGFLYECKECDLSLDINCALFPPAMKHEAHHHFLVRGDFSVNYCNACNSNHWDVFFSCKTCNQYNLGMGCATCPQTVGHRWDKHPLTLSFPPFYYHPDEFICDICEKEIHPKYWLYHCRECRECDNSFHLGCIPRLGYNYPKMKFGGKLQIEYHPHPLTFVREVKYKFRCNKCGKNLKGNMGFECETCYFNLCWPCVRKIVRPKKSN